MADPSAGGRLILAAAAAGLIARLAFGLGYWVHKPLTHDEREYLALAQSVAAGRGFVYDASHEMGTAQQIGRAPVYPLFLAILGAGPGEHDAAPARVKVAQAIVGAIGVGLIGLLARRVAGPKAGVAAAAIAAVYPPLVWICAYVLSEPLYSTLALLAALLLDTALDRSGSLSTTHRSGSAMAAAAGLTAGLAILVRPAMLLFLPLAALWLIAHRRPSLAAVLVVTSLATITPWTVRNFRVYGTFVLIASEGGVTFWTGNHPLARGEGDLAANPDIKARRDRVPRRAPRADRGAARAALLSRRAALYRTASGVVARPARKKSVLHDRPDWPVVYATLDEVPGDVGGLVPAPAAARGRGRARVVARRPPARGALSDGSVGRDRRSRLSPPGAVPDSRHRSGLDCVRGHRLRGAFEQRLRPARGKRVFERRSASEWGWGPTSK